MRDTIILSTFSQRFLLFKNTVQHRRPCMDDPHRQGTKVSTS